MQTLRFVLVTAFLGPMIASGPAVPAHGIPIDALISAETKPMPELGPAEVTRIQLEALRSNTSEDEGIALTYRFASPGNREVTGPLSRFVAMVRSPPYDRLLNHERVEYGPVAIVNERAYQPIIVIDADGEQAGYLWILSKQPSGDCVNCWMTDAVISTDDRAPRQIASPGSQAPGLRS